MLVTAALAFVLVGTGAVYAAHAIARKDALAEAQRSAESIAETVFVPMLPKALRGDPTALAGLRRVVHSRSRDGSVVRIKVWRRDGTVIYSDLASIVGRQFPAGDEIADVIDKQQVHTDLSPLDAAENISETTKFDRLVEVYTPITLADGSRLALEIYSTDARVVAAERELTRLLVPVALGALVVLLIAQLPLSMWLVRRVGRAQQDRSRLLRNTLIASARERQTIARELHDGVVQELAGAGYAVAALASTLPPDANPTTRSTLNKVSGAMQDSVAKLRTAMVDIYPPDLIADGLGNALDELAERLRAQNISVDLSVDEPVNPRPEVVATVYRCAREGLVNVAKHAHAQHVTLSVSSDETTIGLRLHDDGVGLPADDYRPNGHLGLQLIHDAAVDLGGEMHVVSSPGAGTTLTMRLPTAGVAQL
jgi:signal transduction histidine kinase